MLANNWKYSGNTAIIDKYIKYHQMICIQFKLMNKCVTVINYTMMFIFIPDTLILLHQLFFDPLNGFIKVLFVLTLVMLYMPLIGAQFMFALHSKRLHQMCVKLSRLQWRVNGWPFRMRFKLKLLICFEKLSSDRKLGANIGSLGVMTFPKFYKVCENTVLYIQT